ncbi:MAG: hypothetical protein IPL26_21020 [Leptospiraceae bacterium]|nr:hypothetical protein [Leptospiraceae bacterium]
MRGNRMQTITIEVQNPEDAEIILLMAKRLHCRILPEIDSPKNKIPNSVEALKHLRKIAENGGLKHIIPNPVAWKKEIRKDRLLSEF